MSNRYLTCVEVLGTPEVLDFEGRTCHVLLGSADPEELERFMESHGWWLETVSIVHYKRSRTADLLLNFQRSRRGKRRGVPFRLWEALDGPS